MREHTIKFYLNFFTKPFCFVFPELDAKVLKMDLSHNYEEFFNLWVLSRYSGFLPQSKNMTVRLIGFSKLPLGVNECVQGCLSCVCLCCPAMEWQRVPIDCWR
ncbi:hypothetical protein GOODEAATRI_014200 [Goodea atripinnis]|uniref:Uncharacterized protein n=1 Tax=Goodea atripinnis TaxID=208336 RepID=A0ABV0MHP8_9TELE